MKDPDKEFEDFDKEFEEWLEKEKKNEKISDKITDYFNFFNLHMLFIMIIIFPGLIFSSVRGKDPWKENPWPVSIGFWVVVALIIFLI